MGKQAFLNRIKWKSGQPIGEAHSEHGEAIIRVAKQRGPLLYRMESKECFLLKEGEPIPEGVCCYAYLFDQELVKPKDPKPAKVVDERAKHPAIQAARDLLLRFPDKSLWNQIIETVGETPDIALMTRCYQEWTKRGFKPVNLAWLFDWYVKKKRTPPDRPLLNQREQASAEAIEQWKDLMNGPGNGHRSLR